jgi:hypothetical protein
MLCLNALDPRVLLSSRPLRKTRPSWFMKILKETDEVVGRV